MATGKQTKINLLNAAAIQKSVPNNILETKLLAIGYRKKQQPLRLQSQINIELAPASLTAVVGVNGVGKSTLLKTLSGVLPPLSGSVLLNGRDRRGLTSDKLAKLISLVLTGQPFSRNLSVQELVSLGRQPYTNWSGSLSPEDLAAVSKALQQIQVEDLAEKKCFELSDGQLQKVLIARALAQDTPIMILDEPTTHLDIYHKAQVLQLLRKLSSETGKAILFATHEIDLALQVCDKIIVMQPGRVLQGSPSKLIKDSVFDQLFPDDLIQFDSRIKGFRIKK